MDFSLDEEQRRLRETARRFARAEMASVAEEIEAADEPLSGEWRRRYAEMGFLSVNVAADLGGLGLGNLEALIVLEEFARVSSAVAFPIFESCVGPVRAIEHFAGPELKRRVIPRVCAGEIVVAVAMSEPEAGTALTDLVTQGVIEGQHIVLNGTKRWCSGGGHADGYVVYCRLSEGAGGEGDRRRLRRARPARRLVRQARAPDGLSRHPLGRRRLRGRPGAGRQPDRPRRRLS